MVVQRADRRVAQMEHQKDSQKEWWLVFHLVPLMVDYWAHPWVHWWVDSSERRLVSLWDAPWGQR
jgi:hypothetical protein